MTKKSQDLAQPREADRHSAGTARSVERFPAFTDGHSHALYDADDEELDTEPEPESRPTVEELVGMSDVQIRSPNDYDGDVTTGVVEEDDAITVEMDPIAAMIGEELLSEASIDAAPIRHAQRPGTPRDSLSIEPEELGAHFLKEAVQNPGPLDELFASESEGPSSGEKRMLEDMGASREGALITELPDGPPTQKKRPRARKSAVRRVPGPRRAKKAV